MLPQQESTIFRDKVRTGISTIQAQLIEEEIHALFGADLWAIVVYGSRVHHLWVNSSDLDLLVIAENIPDCKSRDDLLLNTCMKLSLFILLYEGDVLSF
jgi:predicted nucleotidyltransferase